MRRREFIAMLGGAAACVAAHSACTTGRALAPRRRALGRQRGRSGNTGPHRGVRSGAGAIGLD